jgi:hypothetical protein
MSISHVASDFRQKSNNFNRVNSELSLTTIMRQVAPNSNPTSVISKNARSQWYDYNY